MKSTHAWTYMILSVALFVWGCSGGSHGLSTLSQEGQRYQAVFDLWTKESRIYDGLETRLIAKATFDEL